MDTRNLAFVEGPPAPLWVRALGVFGLVAIQLVVAMIIWGAGIVLYDALESLGRWFGWH